jgi:1,4-alpha-glucan branching enzyme
MTDMAGSFTFILHAHLPYVLTHGRWPHGADWLNEAAAETYIPLLNVLHRLIREGHTPRVTLGITPILTEQLADPGFKKEFRDYMMNKIEAARSDQKEFDKTGETQLKKVAVYWEEIYKDRLQDFKEKYEENLVEAFSKLQKKGMIEIITCAATHGYLPLLGRDESVQAQIRQATLSYERHYGQRPKGIWLPECAYRPRYEWKRPLKLYAKEPARLRKGVEEFLSEEGLDYFIIDSHLLRGGKAIGIYLDRFEALQKLWGHFSDAYAPTSENTERSPYQAYYVNSFGQEKKRPVSVLTRDPQTGLQVWSGEHGYPGNPSYLDFHKKHFPGGHRYWRVTDIKADLSDKKTYHPEDIPKIVEEQAGHFVSMVKDTLLAHQKKKGQQSILSAPYDAELFGHWWFEGPEWMYHVLKQMDKDPAIDLTTGSRYLSENPGTEVISIPEGSWGEGGFHWIWLNEWTEWIWKKIYEAEDRMADLCKKFRHDKNPDLTRVLNQLGRELLLLQSSDWPFLVSTWSAKDYAELRVSVHMDEFKRLADMAEKIGSKGKLSREDEEYLSLSEERDRIFPDLDYHLWSEIKFPAISS